MTVLRALKFRHRIVLLVAIAAVALLAVTAVTLVLGRRNQRQIAAVETLYVPLLELERDLKALYARIPRMLADAAAAGEEGPIAQADEVHAQLAQRIEAAAATLRGNGGNPTALVDQLAAYYRLARPLTVELVAGTPAAQRAEQIEAMTRAQEAFARALDLAASPDRDRLAAAFAAARESQRTALAIDIAVASVALLLMAFLSLRIIRRTLAALREVSLGMERLARGEFDREIAVTTRDELGDLAREANHTATQLIAARHALEDKAEELARASRYKSEFLANMSHELRTPLNSIMILSKVLGDNEGGTLAVKQVEFAHLIHRSGEELLSLINDVLDLAKIEAGKQEIDVEPVAIAELADYVRSMFQPLAIQKQLELAVEVEPGGPGRISTDRARLAQILKNLLSNAFKFTERGRVAVTFARRGSALAISGHRHRHRHSGRQARGDLRGVHPGGGWHEPQVRRHRPRPDDRAPARGAARRRPRGRQRGRSRQHVPRGLADRPAEQRGARAERRRDGPGRIRRPARRARRRR